MGGSNFGDYPGPLSAAKYEAMANIISIYYLFLFQSYKFVNEKSPSSMVVPDNFFPPGPK